MKHRHTRKRVDTSGTCRNGYASLIRVGHVRGHAEMGMHVRGVFTTL